MAPMTPPPVLSTSLAAACGSALSITSSAPPASAAARFAGSISATISLPFTTALAMPMPARPTPPAPMISRCSLSRRWLTFFSAL
jgi:hypothetical protein